MLGHLWRWTSDPVGLLIDGARTGPVFRLRLWRPVIVGYRPEWNRAVLGDLDTFRSQGSLSRLTPYLSGGIVQSDVPEHDPRRRELNAHFHSRAIAPMVDRLQAAVRPHQPTGPFEALSWSSLVVRRMLGAAFFDGRVPDRILADFLAPLQLKNPGPLLPRPLLFRRLNAAIARVLSDPPEGTIAAAMSSVDNPVEEIRVALAAGYDTTAHTLAWALWHLSDEPRWCHRDVLGLAIDETLRLYPAGWLGSRVVHHDTQANGVDLPAGTMVLYSPLLTHRDPDLWADPTAFRPDRFTAGRTAWAYIPFSAGRRTCLGAHLAKYMLRAAVDPFCDGHLDRLCGDPHLRSSITLRPAGPLWLWFRV
jgi:cytochrome P450